MARCPMKLSGLVVVLLSLVAPPAAQAQLPFSADLDSAAVLGVMSAAADWQLSHPSGHPTDDWTSRAVVPCSRLQQGGSLILRCTVFNILLTTC